MNGKKQNYSICLDDLFAASKANHPAIKAAKNGKKYANITIWENEQPDNYGNHFSVQLYNAETQVPTYIGNGKRWDKDAAQAPQKATNLASGGVDFDKDNMPF